MKSGRLSSGLASVACAVLWPSVINAQTAVSSLADLKQLTAKVTVTDAQGQDFEGTIADVSVSGLSLQLRSGLRRFQAADIRAVRARKEDSLLNGALIGAAVGGGLMSLAFLDNECRDDPVCYKATAVYAGLGALAGLGIDAFHHGKVVVYTAPAPTARRFVAVAPMLGRMRKGALLTIAF
jgi:hypothetical protein